MLILKLLVLNHQYLIKITVH